jgi:hypothetical protein
MALVALAPAVRNASTRSASAAPSRGATFIRWAAGGIPLRPEPRLPVRAVAHSDLGVLVHPEASADELTGALWLYLRAHGVTGDDAEARALILPTARRRLRTVRRKSSVEHDASRQAGDPQGPGPVLGQALGVDTGGQLRYRLGRFVAHPAQRNHAPRSYQPRRSPPRGAFSFRTPT